MTAAIPDDEFDVPLGGPLELQRAWQMMAGGAPEIVSLLMGIARDPNAQGSTRVQAGLGLLKMGGFGSTTEVNVRVVPQQFDQAVGAGDGKESPAKRLEERWAKLREADQPIAVPDDDGIIDAVIVDEDSL
jgi:hypothetical protein